MTFPLKLSRRRPWSLARPGGGAFKVMRRPAHLALLACLLLPPMSSAELAPEPIPQVLSLPTDYPDTWLYAHDSNFFSLVDGKVVIVDVAAENRNYKGQIGAGQFASFIESSRRPELYVAETFYSRRTGGERTDTITIYNKAGLEQIAEIILPGGKRGQNVSLKNNLQLLNEERWLLVFNFTPAASVTVVDIVNREVLTEIAIPGCALIYPSGKTGFGSLCSDGSMLVTELSDEGKLKRQERLPVFFDMEADPLFTKTGRIGQMAYFPSFRGDIQEVDFSSTRPVISARWSLVSEEEKAQGWRPGGWQVITSHPDGRLYVLMHKDGYDGSHKNGGAEVWVFDAKKRQRIRRIVLENWGVTIEVTRGERPYLVVTNADFAMDVYDLEDDKLLRTIGGRAAETPFMLHAVK